MPSSDLTAKSGAVSILIFLFRAGCKDHNLISVQVFDLDFSLVHISKQNRKFTLKWLKQVAVIAFSRVHSYLFRVLLFWSNTSMAL